MRVIPKYSGIWGLKLIGGYLIDFHYEYRNVRRYRFNEIWNKYCPCKRCRLGAKTGYPIFTELEKVDIERKSRGVAP